ncbi:MAG: hypothetical protein ACUVUR_02690 [bacterium]
MQQVGSALVSGNSREIYRMFVPAFCEEHSFARFDSAVRSWQGNRRVSRVKSQLIDVKGLGGYASTYVIFEGEKDYNYLYQSWIYTDSGWQLVWISNILGQSFQYGTKDTAAVRSVVRLALSFLLSPAGLKWIRAGKVSLPETIIVVEKEPLIDSLPVLDRNFLLWRTVGVIEKDPIPAQVPFYCELGVVRVYGSVAQVSLDLKPWSAAGRRMLKKSRGTELYLKRGKGGWEVYSTGKRW